MNRGFEPTFDYICHPLRCTRCDEVPSDPCSIDLQTKLALVKGLRTIRVGDRIELDPDPKEGGGYLETRKAHDANRLVAIEAWSCPNCGTGFLWARVVFEDGVLQSVEPVELTEETLSSADYITSEVLMLFPTERTPEINQLPSQILRAELLKTEAAYLTEQDG